MSLIDIPIPFNGGSAQNIYNEDNLLYNTGQKYTYVGGNNGRKFISIRFQDNPSYIHVHTFEVDSLTSSAPVFTNLGGLATSIDLAGGDQHARTMEAVRINSTTVYLRLFTGTGSSKHLLIEMNETDNSTTITDVTPVEETYNGGAYSYHSGNHRSLGAGLWHMFMYNLKENSIVMVSLSTQTARGYTFVQVDIDPVTKVLTYKTILNGGGTYYNEDLEEPNLIGSTGQYIIMSSDGNGYDLTSCGMGINLSGNISIGRGGAGIHKNVSPYTSQWTSQQHDYTAFVTTTESRNGNEVHFSLMGTSYYSNDDGLSHVNFRELEDARYVVTYVKDTHSWRTTSRHHNDSGFNTNKLGCWLPLNTVPSVSLAGNDTAIFTQDQHHCDTWISVGAYNARVVGSTSGGLLTISDSTKRADSNSIEPTTSSQAFQAMWLNEDHFIVIWCRNPSQNYHYNQQNANSSMNYTIVKYIDENIMEVIVHDRITGYAGAPDFSYADMQVFQKSDQFTLISDKFSRFVSLSAPE